MEIKEIESGNRLIAGFMDKPNLVNAVDVNGDWYVKYHSSWDWLMPVVEKISENYDVIISSTGMWACYINRKDSDSLDSIADFGGFEPMILNVWKAVVKFIMWYNTKSKFRKKDG